MKVGLVLSGGGARGIAHLGMIKALEEWGVRFESISGTSVGAILGALYANGMTPDEILEVILQANIYRSLRPAWTLKGLLRPDSLRGLLDRHIAHNNFSSLKLKLIVVATDLESGKARYFSTGELIPALLASCCVPGMFNPIQIDGRTYVDGGIVDNLPAKILRSDCDFIIGLHCNPIVEVPTVSSLKSVIERTLLLAINGNAGPSKALCDVVIEPPELGRVSTFEVAKARQLLDIGYKFTKQHFTPQDFQRT
ncbi:MAG: patatin-like phospholipase family protein [Chryseolinea sp.]